MVSHKDSDVDGAGHDYAYNYDANMPDTWLREIKRKEPADTARVSLPQRRIRRAKGRRNPARRHD